MSSCSPCLRRSAGSSSRGRSTISATPRSPPSSRPPSSPSSSPTPSGHADGRRLLVGADGATSMVIVALTFALLGGIASRWRRKAALSRLHAVAVVATACCDAEPWMLVRGFLLGVGGGVTRGRLRLLQFLPAAHRAARPPGACVVAAGFAVVTSVPRGLRCLPSSARRILGVCATAPCIVISPPASCPAADTRHQISFATAAAVALARRSARCGRSSASRARASQRFLSPTSVEEGVNTSSPSRHLAVRRCFTSRAIDRMSCRDRAHGSAAWAREVFAGALVTSSRSGRDACHGSLLLRYREVQLGVAVLAAPVRAIRRQPRASWRGWCRGTRGLILRLYCWWARRAHRGPSCRRRLLAHVRDHAPHLTSDCFS